MCLAGLGEREAALILEAAVASVLAELPSFAGPGMGRSTEELGQLIADRVSEIDPPQGEAGARSLMSALGGLAQRRSATR